MPSHAFRVEAALNDVTARAYEVAGADMTLATPKPNARARS